MKTLQKITLSLFFTFNVIVFASAQNYTVLSTVNLEADGPQGVETYELIKSVLGSGAMEVPDLYPENHPEVKHVIEETDGIIGNHFTFLIHRDIDKDRDTKSPDRQRNEIKAYSSSVPELKAYNGESLRYHWFFQLDAGFTISNNFSHFFQLKAVGGNYDSQPLVTLSGSRNSSNPEFEIIHSSLTGAEDVQLVNTSWSEANTGQWMEVEVLATYEDNGYLKVSVTNMNGDTIMVTENDNIDMWREGSDFVRPKWGIYRSLSSSQYLSPDEERARFADFSVQKVILNSNPNSPEQAHTPYPFHQASFIDNAITLNWSKGEGTNYHEIYLGNTSQLTATHYLGSTTASEYNVSQLEPEQTYYWRIDEGNEEGITTGSTWSFTTAPAPLNCTNSTALEITEVLPSSNSTNYPVSNLTDNNFDTGWAVTGDNQWVTFDMGIPVTLTHLMIAFYEGTNRRNNFMIEASEDNINFETLAHYESSGTTTNYETIRTPETEARYIRYTINGTSADTAPIITEISVYGCAGTTDPVSMHVNTVVTDTENAAKGNKYGIATVTIYDDKGNPVNNATVTGTFSGTFSESVTGITGPDGTVTLKTTTTQKGGVIVELCVDDVTHPVLTYAAADNVATCSNELKSLVATNQTDTEASELSIYPNPTSGLLNISILVDKVEIMDFTGKRIKTINTPVNLIDVSELKQGPWILKITQNNTVHNKLFIKQ